MSMFLDFSRLGAIIRFYMGFAELEGRCPTADIRNIVKRKKERQTDLQAMPLVVVLASMFAEEGKDGVKELMSSLTRSGLNINPEREFFQQIPPEFQGPIKLNYALIIFGVTVASIHEMLINGELDGSVWGDRYNMLITGTLLPQAVIPKESMERLSAEDLKNLRRHASQDKSLASFFDEHFELLPKVLQSTLRGAGALHFIQDVILPLYKERAQYLLSLQA